MSGHNKDKNVKETQIETSPKVRVVGEALCSKVRDVFKTARMDRPRPFRRDW